MTQVAVSPVRVTVFALDPNHKPTTALAGRVGTIGGTKKPAVWVAAARATGVILAPADDVLVEAILVFTVAELEGILLDDVVEVMVPVFTEAELEVFALALLLLLVPTAVIPALMTRGLYI